MIVEFSVSIFFFFVSRTQRKAVSAVDMFLLSGVTLTWLL